MSGRIQQGAERLKHLLVEAFEDVNRKRPAPIEPTDGLSEVKRQRLDAQVPTRTQAPQPFQPPPLPPGPVSYAQLFTLTQEQGLKNFDANVIPWNILQNIVVPLLASIDKTRMDQAINVCIHPSSAHVVDHVMANLNVLRLFAHDIWTYQDRHPPALLSLQR